MSKLDNSSIFAQKPMLCILRSDFLKAVRNRVDNFCNSVGKIYTPDEFKIHFRMS